MASAKPIILAVDDDVPVLRAVERDLRGRYGNDYRVVAASEAQEALDAVRQLSLRGSTVALFVVDQRMPRMTGIEFLSQALELQPDAKRVLLTAYADTDVAIRAINDIRLDHYILKPWDPPEEKLFPITDDLLSDWSATFRPTLEGLRLLSGRWAPGGHDIRDYLTRNQVPYVWLDPSEEGDGQRLAAGLAGEEPVDPSVPVILFPDGSSLRNPTHMQIAEKVGLQTRAALPFYDVVIVGGGPAGLAAAVYGASEGLKTLLIEREAPGGQAGTTSRIENYLGFPAGLSGGDLARRALAQARRLGAEILSPQEVTGVRRDDPYRVVTLGDGTEVSCQTVVVATGVSYRQLKLPEADRLAGAGIYYGAATTEAILYRDAEVGVVGGGNSAGQAAVYLARFAKRVLLLVRGGALSGMSQYLIDQMAAIPNIEVRVSTEVTSVTGETHLSSATLRGPDGDEEVALSALFVFIGQSPRTDWLEGAVIRDDAGFVPTGAALMVDGKPPSGWGLKREPFLLEASMPGVFCAGDVRSRSVKRIASAVGEGSMTVQFVHQYLAGL
jgi:thioredoxin reductase (NADPH)